MYEVNVELQSRIREFDRIKEYTHKKSEPSEFQLALRNLQACYQSGDISYDEYVMVIDAAVRAYNRLSESTAEKIPPQLTDATSQIFGQVLTQAYRLVAHEHGQQELALEFHPIGDTEPVKARSVFQASPSVRERAPAIDLGIGLQPALI